MRNWSWLVLTVAAAAVVLLGQGREAGGQQSVQVEVVVRNLEIPWAADFAPDGRVFLSERPGRIRIIRGGHLEPQPWATLPVAHVGEGGLLGLVLAPDFARSGFVYVYHTYEQTGRLWNRVVRMVERDGRGQVDRVILDRIPGAGLHDGGRLKFGRLMVSCTSPLVTRANRHSRKSATRSPARFCGLTRTAQSLPIIPFRTRLFTRWAIAIRRAWPGTRTRRRCMNRSTARRGNLGCAATTR